MEEFVVPKLTGQRILEVLRKMKNSSCPGLDGWRVAELRALPLQLLDLLADIFNVIEETGVWPASLAEGVVSLSRKEKEQRRPSCGQ